MAAASLAMSEIAGALNKSSDQAFYQALSNNITSQLSNLFWNEARGFYVDVVNDEPLDHVGFPGMLPLCLNLEKNISRLSSILEKMFSAEELLDAFGLLSLSKKDPEFRTTGNYWRGNIWLNVQYLCLRGIKNLEDKGLLPQSTLKQKRKALQYSVLSNMLENYRLNSTKGGVYETYHPFTGLGYNNLPFTGWSSLALLMMSEDYL